MTDKVKENMSRMVLCFFRDEPIAEAYKMMKDYNIRHIPIIEGKRLVGMVSDRDLLLNTRSYMGNEFPKNLTMEDIMSVNLVTIQDDCSISDAASLMLNHKIDSLPVVAENDQLIGIITTTDLLELLADKDFQENKGLPYTWDVQNYADRRAM